MSPFSCVVQMEKREGKAEIHFPCHSIPWDHAFFPSPVAASSLHHCSSCIPPRITLLRPVAFNCTSSYIVIEENKYQLHYTIQRVDTQFGNDAQSTEESSLTVIIMCQNLNEQVSEFIDRVAAVNQKAVLYVLSSDGTFGAAASLWDFNHKTNARVIHCDPMQCDHLFLAIAMYEVQSYVAIVRLEEMSAMPPSEYSSLCTEIISQLKQFTSQRVIPKQPLSTSANQPVFTIYASSFLRGVASNPIYRIEYGSFNPITRISSFTPITIPSSSQTNETLNIRTAVILTLFARNYLHSVLSHLCNQTLVPEMIVFVQNMHNVSLSREIIPSQCLNHNIRFYHIWLSNWNSFSFMRHFVPIPSSIHNTALVDDDMFLKRDALEMGVRTMQQHSCIATERGRRIDGNPEGHPNWPFFYSTEMKELTLVDYAFIPLFEQTAWRRSVYKIQPFSRVYGDILFVSLAIYQDIGVPSCVVPRYDFFERNEDGDKFSTSKKNRVLYNQYYNGIASEWQRRGYLPVQKRS